MGDRLRRVGRRLAGLGMGFVDAFVRDNRVLPPVLAAMAVFVAAWLLAGAVLGGDDGGTDQKPVAHRADLAQSDDAPGPDPVDPDVENRDVDSYAAYRSKDPFREVLAPAETTSEQTTSQPAPEDTTGNGRTRPGPTAGDRARDTDDDGIPDRRERTRGTDPNNADTDGDGVQDSDDDTDDGRPDDGAGAGGVPAGGRAAGDRPDERPDDGTDGRAEDRADDRGVNRGGGLLNSGGTLPPP